jgi:hypothetical protein
VNAVLEALARCCEGLVKGLRRARKIDFVWSGLLYDAQRAGRARSGSGFIEGCSLASEQSFQRPRGGLVCVVTGHTRSGRRRPITKQFIYSSIHITSTRGRGGRQPGIAIYAASVTAEQRTQAGLPRRANDRFRADFEFTCRKLRGGALPPLDQSGDFLAVLVAAA